MSASSCRRCGSVPRRNHSTPIKLPWPSCPWASCCARTAIWIGCAPKAISSSRRNNGDIPDLLAKGDAARFGVEWRKRAEVIGFAGAQRKTPPKRRRPDEACPHLLGNQECPHLFRHSLVALGLGDVQRRARVARGVGEGDARLCDVVHQQ